MFGLQDLAVFVLGWLAGVAGPIVVDRNKRRRDAKETLTAAKGELQDLQYRLAAVNYSLLLQVGPFDRESLTWVRDTIGDYNREPEASNIVATLDGLLAYNDQELATAGNLHLANRSQMGLSMCSLEAPMLDAMVRELRMFKPETQHAVLDIRSQLGYLREQIATSNKWFDLTFDSSLTSQNQDRVTKNLGASYVVVRDRTRLIADRIGESELE
jgi:hypothetical protein